MWFFLSLSVCLDGASARRPVSHGHWWSRDTTGWRRTSTTSLARFILHRRAWSYKRSVSAVHQPDRICYRSTRPQMLRHTHIDKQIHRYFIKIKEELLRWLMNRNHYCTCVVFDLGRAIWWFLCVWGIAQWRSQEYTVSCGKTDRRLYI